MERALALTLQHLREMIPSEATQELTVSTMVRIRDTVASELGGAATVGHEEIRFVAFLRTLEHVGAPSQAAAERLHQIYMDARLSSIAPYPDAPGALKAPKGRYRLGMLSDGNTDPERSGVRPDTFDFIVYAHEYGFAKPDRRIFEVALAKSGCQPEEVLHIGDSLEDDVLGANGCGMHSHGLTATVHATKPASSPISKSLTCTA